LQEKAWNAYYAHLLLRLCGAAKSHKMTLQVGLFFVRSVHTGCLDAWLRRLHLHWGTTGDATRLADCPQPCKALCCRDIALPDL
jgi:hypothetical protein